MKILFSQLFFIAFLWMRLSFFSHCLLYYHHVKSKAAFRCAMLAILILIPFNLVTGCSKATAIQKEEDRAEETFTVLTSQQRDSIARVENGKIIEARQQQTVTAVVLTRDYMESEANADALYNGKHWYLEGTVLEIKKDISDNVYVMLKGAETFREVQCYLNDNAIATGLEAGMKVTFYGRCEGTMLYVLMKNCKLVDNLDTLKAQQ